MPINSSWLTQLAKPINRLLNKNGQAYSLTVLAPIKRGEVDVLRAYLADLPPDSADSPLARVLPIHNARFNIIDELPFEGAPALYDHLVTQYLLFSCNFDTGNTNWRSVAQDLAAFLGLLFAAIPEEIQAIWGHCVGFPEPLNLQTFQDFIGKHQLHGGFFFADYPHNTAAEALRALFEQKQFVNFVIAQQPIAAGNPSQLKESFYKFYAQLADMPTPPPGSMI